MEKTQIIRVEVAYATPERQHLVTLQVPVGTTIADAVKRCREQRLLPEAAFQYSDLGVFGRSARAERVLEPGDRVEIYRPLKVDPKETRRRRAQGGRRRSNVKTSR